MGLATLFLRILFQMAGLEIFALLVISVLKWLCFSFNDIMEHSDYGVRQEVFILHFFKAFIINTLYLARFSPGNTLRVLGYLGL